MHLKEIEKNATCAWSPFLRQSPMLVAGTVSGAMDATFNSEAELGVYDLSVQSAGVNAVLLASISAPSRFNRLAWSPFVDAPYGSSEGIIIGGMEDGSLGFWHAGKLVANEYCCSFLAGYILDPTHSSVSLQATRDPCGVCRSVRFSPSSLLRARSMGR